MALYSQFYVFDSFLELVHEGVINLQSATIKAYLSNVAPVQSTTQKKADLTLISDGGGWVGANGLSVPSPKYSRIASRKYEWIGDSSINLTATGTVSAFRYVSLGIPAITSPYTCPLWGFFDLGISVGYTEGDIFRLNLLDYAIYRASQSAS